MNNKFKKFIDSFSEKVEGNLSGIDRINIVKELLEILKLDECGKTFEAGVKTIDLTFSNEFKLLKKEILEENPNNRIINNNLSIIGDFNARIDRENIKLLLDFLGKNQIIKGSKEILISKTLEETGVQLNNENCISTVINDGPGILSDEIVELASDINELSKKDNGELPDENEFLKKHSKDIFNDFTLTKEETQLITNIIKQCLPELKQKELSNKRK